MPVAIVISVVILFYFFMVFPRRTEKKRILDISPSMFAHRGYHDIAHRIPENSMTAFHAAIQHGYGIELDLHLTRDGQLIVFHDDTLERLCGRPGRVEDLTYDELKSLCLLGTDERIPLFSEVLAAVNGRVPLLIELKIPTFSLKICEETYRILKSYSGHYMIQSFNTMGLRWFRLHAPHILRGQLAEHLTARECREAWLLKFLVQNLFCNFLGRPDFISYRLSDLPHLSVLLLKYIFRVPIAVWTLTTNEELKKGMSGYHIQIFEKHGENY